MLTRFWISFAPLGRPTPLNLGCGITAHDSTEALEILRTKVFGGAPLPGIEFVHADVDVSTLDPKHVLPNIGNPAVRGVWFPLGYS